MIFLERGKGVSPSKGPPRPLRPHPVAVVFMETERQGGAPSPWHLPPIMPGHLRLFSQLRGRPGALRSSPGAQPPSAHPPALTDSLLAPRTSCRGVPVLACLECPEPHRAMTQCQRMLCVSLEPSPGDRETNVRGARRRRGKEWKQVLFRHHAWAAAGGSRVNVQEYKRRSKDAVILLFIIVTIRSIWLGATRPSR